MAGARPRWRASGHIDWHSGPWIASYAVEYIGSYSETVSDWQDFFGIAFDPFVRRVDPVLYHDLEAGFKFDAGVSVRAAITNVTDEDPPYLNVAPANTDPATYRMLGRTYFWNCATTSSSGSKIAGASDLAIAGSGAANGSFMPGLAVRECAVALRSSLNGRDGESRGLLRTRSTCQSVPRIR